jgi:electron transport complex protein RnfG
MSKMIIVLTAVMVLSGLVLAATYSGLTDRIEENRIAALNASLAAIFEGRADADEIDFEELDSDGPVIYRGSAAGQTLGYAVRLETQGYGGTITMLVGLSEDAETIRGISIVEQVETPGLGGNITRDEFREQFEGLDASAQISYVKNIEPDPAANEIQALSGATITSSAIVSGINGQLDQARETIARQAR